MRDYTALFVFTSNWCAALIWNQNLKAIIIKLTFQNICPLRTTHHDVLPSFYTSESVAIYVNNLFFKYHYEMQWNKKERKHMHTWRKTLGKKWNNVKALAVKCKRYSLQYTLWITWLLTLLSLKTNVIKDYSFIKCNGKALYETGNNYWQWPLLWLYNQAISYFLPYPCLNPNHNLIYINSYYCV